jgi:hypothetical protein
MTCNHRTLSHELYSALTMQLSCWPLKAGGGAETYLLVTFILCPIYDDHGGIRFWRCSCVASDDVGSVDIFSLVSLQPFNKVAAHDRHDRLLLYRPPVSIRIIYIHVEYACIANLSMWLTIHVAHVTVTIGWDLSTLMSLPTISA